MSTPYYSKRKLSVVLLFLSVSLILCSPAGFAEQECRDVVSRSASFLQSPQKALRDAGQRFWQMLKSFKSPWQRPVNRIVEIQVRKAIASSISTSFELLSGYNTFGDRVEYFYTHIWNRREKLNEQKAILRLGRQTIAALKSFEESGDSIEIRQRWFRVFSEELSRHIHNLKYNLPPSLDENDVDAFNWSLDRVFINEVQFMKLIEGSLKVYTRQYRSQVLTQMASIRSFRILTWFIPDDPVMGLLVYPGMVAVPIGLASSTGMVDPVLNGYAVMIYGSGMIALPLVAMGSFAMNFPQQMINVPRSVVNRFHQRQRTLQITNSISQPIIEFIASQKATIQAMSRSVENKSTFDLNLPELISDSEVADQKISPTIIDRFSEEFNSLGNAYKSMSQIILGQVLNVPHPFKQKSEVAFEILRLLAKEGRTIEIDSKEQEMLGNETERLALRDKLISLTKERLEAISEVASRLQVQIERVALNEFDSDSPLLDSVRIERFDFLQRAISTLVQSILGTLKIIDLHQQTTQETAKLIEQLESTENIINAIGRLEDLTEESQLFELELKTLVDIQKDFVLSNTEIDD